MRRLIAFLLARLLPFYYITEGLEPDRDAAKSVRQFYHWYWSGRCPDCEGRGTLQVWSKGMPERDTEPRVCWYCNGSGLQDQAS